MGTTLLKKSRGRYNHYRGVGAKVFLSSRPNQIASIIVVFFVIAILSLLWREWVVEDHSPQSPVTPSILPVLFTETPTYIAIPMPSRTRTPEPTSMPSPTATSTQTLEPTPTVVIGYGKVTKNVFTFEEPGGKTLEEILPQGQSVSCVMDKVNHSGFTYYKCKWEYHNSPSEGWIIGSYIQFNQTYTPTP